MSRLLEKTGIENVTNLPSGGMQRSDLLENLLVNMKGLNARYDKNDALTQVQWLMEKYNIQIDELLERIA